MDQDIQHWDGKSVGDIEAIYRQYSHQRNFISKLMQCLEREELQTGATWLLKHHFQNGHHKITSSQKTSLFNNLSELSHWEAKLHTLQIFPRTIYHSIRYTRS